MGELLCAPSCSYVLPYRLYQRPNRTSSVRDVGLLYLLPESKLSLVGYSKQQISAGADDGALYCWLLLVGLGFGEVGFWFSVNREEK